MKEEQEIEGFRFDMSGCPMTQQTTLHNMIMTILKQCAMNGKMQPQNIVIAQLTALMQFLLASTVPDKDKDPYDEAMDKLRKALDAIESDPVMVKYIRGNLKVTKAALDSIGDVPSDEESRAE